MDCVCSTLPHPSRPALSCHIILWKTSHNSMRNVTTHCMTQNTAQWAMQQWLVSVRDHSDDLEAFVPLLIKVQELAYQLKKRQPSRRASKIIPKNLDLVQFYIDQKYSVGSPVHKMLCQALACKRMVLAFDGFGPRSRVN